MSTQKGFAPVLIVIILAIAAFGGYFVYQKSHITPTLPTPTQIACTQDAKLCPDGSYVSRTGPKCDFAPCPSPKESTSSADMSNWKTYKNNEYSFKYPADFVIRERQNRYSFMTTQQITTLLIEDNNQGNLLYLEIFSEANPKNFTSEQFFNNYLDSLKKGNGPETKYVVAKVNRTLKPYSNGNINGTYALLGWDYDFDTIVQTRDNQVYTFLYGATNAGNQKYQEQIIDQILSTFRFTQ